ncbi:tripartite tricarboxylate transporter substrate binding protein [Mycolicibacterium hodleri]|uniref:Tripartite tricarboxylate transporter substrate binding protein n=1 Tax=Mycolicibacterium hodleri TaxID=49897 RepID=A0A502EIC1_9MYCO|nr:tripartite tricarboxylate transporter substrate-binding protein [Mycolicibacterium hodleri]TPG37448.1 tripartite tricarboxylate transporter substrate binding protein [Mycolicibacterium hodleri]
MIKAAIGALLAVSLLLTGCQHSEPSSGAVDYPSQPVTMTAGANPGSGFDITIRSVVDALKKEEIVNVPLPVQNRPGSSGADFLATMVEQYRGRDDQISVTSLSMMTNQLRGKSRYGYGDVTMIARLMTEYYVVVTRRDSPLKNLEDLMTAIKSDPARVAVGAALDDEAPFDLLVAAAGGDPASIRYVTHEGGGDQSAALLKGDISVAIGGVSEFIGQVKSGELTALGVLADEPLPGLDVRTAKEQGFDVTLSNWRGLYGPPGMPQSAVAYWQEVLGRMVQSPTWTQIAQERQFTTTFMIGDEFQTFLAKTQADVKVALTQAGR